MSHDVFPRAFVAGQPVTEIPADLFVPPDALEILLEKFTGPLDLLLYLIRKQNIDIMDIPISKITEQYMQYIELIEQHRLELAADYLVMAAILIEIKSRFLLPVEVKKGDDEEAADPRIELVRRLQQYEQFKQAADNLNQLSRYERDIFSVQAEISSIMYIKPLPSVSLAVIIEAMANVLIRSDNMAHHKISRESLSVSDRMVNVLEMVNEMGSTKLTSLFAKNEGRIGLAVTFIAVLELSRQTLISLTQTQPFASVYIQAIVNE